MKNNTPKVPREEIIITIPEGKKAYFLSDIHLGAPALKNNRMREQKIVEWLEKIKADCAVLFLLGDVFDFWFEYQYAAPQGYIRFLGKICEFTDAGIPIHFFVGNHDTWVGKYLARECGITIHTDNRVLRLNDKHIFVGHGDALNPNDKGYLFLRWMFHNRFLQSCFRLVHPDLGIWIAKKWSSHSRLENGTIEAKPFQNEENEEIIRFCKQMLQTTSFDYFIFGHRHLAMDISLGNNSRYINTGDWITYDSFATFDGNTIQLIYNSQACKPIIR